MKNLVGFVLLALLVSSCSLFQKQSMSQEQIDVMVAENSSLKSQITKSKDMDDQLALVRMQLDEAMLKLADCEEAAMSRVHIITGAFKTASYADEYAATMKGQGYDGEIIAGPYNFHLVTASSHESIQAAINSLGPIRDGVIETSWIYME
ncbi:MAG: hypothetical protein GY790_23090 [Bacteroidetes bacterium]|nr:hypothetical protein [Bacteroidota bacterium]